MRTIRLRALKTAPMPEPTRRGLEFDAPEDDARRYIASGWAVEHRKPAKASAQETPEVTPAPVVEPETTTKSEAKLHK